MSSIPDVLAPFPVGDDTPDMMSGCIPPLPDVSHLISAHGKRRGNHCQVGDGSVMSPMQEAEWFTLPQMSLVAATPTRSVILGANPMRVGIMFCFCFPMDVAWDNSSFATQFTLGGGAYSVDSSDTPGVVLQTQNYTGGVANFTAAIAQSVAYIAPQVTPITSVNEPYGIPIFPDQPRLEITQKEWGPLVQGAWTALSVPRVAIVEPNCNITIIEVILKDWPSCKEESNGA